MRLVSIIGHPALTLGSIFIIMISGENNGGIYGQFFLMNLLSFQLFSILCAIGLIILLAGFIGVQKSSDLNGRLAMYNIVGIILIILSVILFLYRLPWEFSYQTYSGIPLISLVLATLCSIAFITNNCRSLYKRKSG